MLDHPTRAHRTIRQHSTADDQQSDPADGADRISTGMAGALALTSRNGPNDSLARPPCPVEQVQPKCDGFRIAMVVFDKVPSDPRRKKDLTAAFPGWRWSAAKLP